MPNTRKVKLSEKALVTHTPCGSSNSPIGDIKALLNKIDNSGEEFQ
ncbi:hypothetical protein QMK38_18700 [Lysinibacillus fusiformis]|nr:hypothetical protein [Lysinibacillus fusiformis]